MTKAKEALDEFKNASDSWCYAELFLNHSETIREALELLDTVQNTPLGHDFVIRINQYETKRFLCNNETRIEKSQMVERKDYDRE